MKKITTRTSSANNNGGLHSVKQFKTAVSMLTDHPYSQPRLYHIVFTASQFTEDYQAAMKALCFELRRKNIECQWRSCIEFDEPEEIDWMKEVTEGNPKREKGLHLHLFILCEAKNLNPCSIINYEEQGWLNVMLLKRGIEYTITQANDKMHLNKKGEKLNYCTLAGDKLADCIDRISYLYKRRSKSKDIRRTYFSSRESKNV